PAATFVRVLSGSSFHHGYRHSFPTRRSSDLLANTSGFVYYVSITGITGAAAADDKQVGEAVARIKRHTQLPVCVGFGIRTPEAADRKSTRLNSSHVKISYAVYCWKKKEVITP